MARSEWLRTFVAVYRAGAVTDGAAARGISQPAASQQLARLERAVGTPLFVRTPRGMEPTRAGGELYARVADAFDQLELVLDDLDAGAVSLPPRRVRIGASPEVFAHLVVPRVAPRATAVDARFGDDAQLLDLLTRAEIDIAITTTGAPRRVATTIGIGERDFALVTATASAPASPLRTLRALGRWLSNRPWVGYSEELPITRRFWRTHLHTELDAPLRLVAADLRVVGAAVEAGMGVSLLPRFVCDGALAAGRLVEVYPVAGLVPTEPWTACVRPGDVDRSDIAAVLDALAAPTTPG